MKRLLTSSLLINLLWTVAAFGVTNNPTLPLSSLPTVGTNVFTTNDFVVGDNWQAGNPVTVKFPLSALPNYVITNGNLSGILTNFISTNPIPLLNATGVVNAIDGTNPSVTIGFPLEMTNQILTAYGVGGIIAAGVLASNVNAVAIGDSYVDGIGFGSTLSAFGQAIRAMYGDGGQAGKIGGWGGGWYNLPPLSRNPPASIWPAGLIGEITPADNTWNSGIVSTSAIAAFQGTQGNNASNYCNAVGVCYDTSLWSTNFAMTISGPAEGYTNRIVVNDNAAIAFNMTNVPVPLGCDYSISVCSLGGTNFVICANFLNTNHAVTYWQFGFAGCYIDQIIGPGTNFWAGLLRTIKANIVIYHSIHLGTTSGGWTDSSFTNLVYGLLSSAPTNASVNILAPPPNQASTMAEINWDYRAICSGWGYGYADLWGRFPSFIVSSNRGQMYSDWTHPSWAGCNARAASALDLFGCAAPGPMPVDFRNVAGPMPQALLPSNVLTNGESNPFGITFNDYVYMNYGFQLLGGADLFPSYVLDHYAATWRGLGSLAAGTLTGGSITGTNTVNAGTNNAAVATAGSLTVTNSATIKGTNSMGAIAITGATSFPTGTLTGSAHVDNTSGHDQFIQVSATAGILIWTNGYNTGNSTSWYIYGDEGFPFRNGWSISVPSGTCNYQLMQ